MAEGTSTEDEMEPGIGFRIGYGVIIVRATDNLTLWIPVVFALGVAFETVLSNH